MIQFYLTHTIFTSLSPKCRETSRERSQESDRNKRELFSHWFIVRAALHKFVKFTPVSNEKLSHNWKRSKVFLLPMQSVFNEIHLQVKVEKWRKNWSNNELSKGLNVSRFVKVSTVAWTFYAKTFQRLCCLRMKLWLCCYLLIASLTISCEGKIMNLIINVGANFRREREFVAGYATRKLW